MPNPDKRNVNDPASTHDDEVLEVEDEGVETDVEENESQTDDLSIDINAQDDELGVDLSQVPAELKPILEKYEKQMKSTLTKKTQAVAEMRKSMEKIGYKAEVLDRLMGDPRVLNFLAGLQGDGGAVGNDDSEGEPDPQKMVAQAVQPLYNDMQRMKIEIERDQFIKNHPDWELHLDGMNEAWEKQPGLTFEGAYLQAVGAKYIAAKARAEKAKKIPKVEKPGPTKPSKTALKVTNFDDAVKAALEEHGIDKRRIYDE